MRIAFDATAILGPMSKNRGIGNYVLSQFLHMIRQDPDNQYFFLNWIDKDFHLSDQLPGVINLTEDFIDTGSQNVLLREKACEEVMGAICSSICRNGRLMFFISPLRLSRTLSAIGRNGCKGCEQLQPFMISFPT